LRLFCFCASSTGFRFQLKDVGKIVEGQKKKVGGNLLFFVSGEEELEKFNGGLVFEFNLSTVCKR
jgi:hypothetical protein